MTQTFALRIRETGVSVILGSYNRKTFLRAALESIRSIDISVPYEIIVVDGGSTDGSLKYLASQKDVVTIIQHNRGKWKGKELEKRSWGGFMNLGFKAARGKYICMISDDSLLIPGSVEAGIRCIEKHREQGENAAAAAFYWREWPDEEQYKVGQTFGAKIFVNHGLYLRSALEQIGWIDEDSYAFYHADGDLCLRLWDAGFSVVDCKEAFVEHFRHASISLRKKNISAAARDWETYQARWVSVYPQPEPDECEPWLYISHEDRNRTAHLFPRLKVFGYFSFNRSFRWIKSLIKQLLNALGLNRISLFAGKRRDD